MRAQYKSGRFLNANGGASCTPTHSLAVFTAYTEVFAFVRLCTEHNPTNCDGIVSQLFSQEQISACYKISEDVYVYALYILVCIIEYKQYIKGVMIAIKKKCISLMVHKNGNQDALSSCLICFLALIQNNCPLFLLYVIRVNLRFTSIEQKNKYFKGKGQHHTDETSNHFMGFTVL